MDALVSPPIFGIFIIIRWAKTPPLLQPLLSLAESGERILLHPHDFAEDGRPGNYLSLSEVYQWAYPTGANIHYAALNQRDRGFLAHMLQDSPSPVHLLANAVPPSSPFSTPQGGNTFNLPENLLLYPVRAVRRKPRRTCPACLLSPRLSLCQ